MKVVPFYDRSDLIALTTRTVERNLLRGMLLVVVVLIFFLYDFRAGLIVAVTIPLALLFAFICLDLQHASANLLSIGAIDFGILVDGAVVMVENIFRQLAERDEPAGQRLRDHPRGGRGGRPAAVLRGRGDRRQLPADLRAVRTLRQAVQADGGHHDLRADRLADRHADAAAGAVLLVHAQRRARAAQRDLRADQVGLHRAASIAASRGRWSDDRRLGAAAGCFAAARSRDIGAEFMPHLDEGALWVRATMPYTISFDEAAKIVAAGPRRSCAPFPR